MTRKQDEENWADLAQALLEAGEWQKALDVLVQAPQDDGLRWLLSSAAWLEMHELDLATEDLAEARRLLGAEDPDVLRAEADLMMASWQFERAQGVLEKLDPGEWGAQLLVDRSLVADALGDPERAHKLLEEAHGLAPRENPPPLRLTAEAFQEIVAEAGEALPEEFQAVFDTVAVVIDPMPTAEVLEAPQSGHPPDLLGLYLGLPIAEHESGPGGDLPPVIYLFQRNLERMASDLDELREEIRITLYHELAHALGFEEEGVEEMGLG